MKAIAKDDIINQLDKIASEHFKVSENLDLDKGLREYANGYASAIYYMKMKLYTMKTLNVVPNYGEYILQQEPLWNSVEDSLPPAHVRVVVLFENGDVGSFYQHWRECETPEELDNHLTYELGDQLIKITHWVLPSVLASAGKKERA